MVGASASSSGPSGARPCSTTSGREPFTVLVPNIGVGWPFTGTARSHRASSTAATSRSRGDGRVGSTRAPPPRPRRARSSTRLPNGVGSRTASCDPGAEREAADDADHPGDRTDQRRAHRHRAATVAGFAREAGADHQGRRAAHAARRCDRRTTGRASSRGARSPATTRRPRRSANSPRARRPRRCRARASRRGCRGRGRSRVRVPSGKRDESATATTTVVTRPDDRGDDVGKHERAHGERRSAPIARQVGRSAALADTARTSA